MSGFQKLLEIPSVPKILEMLVARPGGITEEEVASAVGEEHGKAAIALLVDHGLVRRSRGLIVINPGKENPGKIQNVIDFFRTVRAATEASLIVRGLLTANVYFQCLVHTGTLIELVESAGILKENILRAVTAEEKQGRIERRIITYRARGSLRERFFPYIPLHHYDDFVSMTGRHVQQVEGGGGLPSDRISFIKEEYLLGHYPSRLAEQGRNFTEEHYGHLLSRVRNESFDLIWWYDRY